MTLEKNLMAFKRKMNEIKSNNIMKKSSQEQFSIIFKFIWCFFSIYYIIFIYFFIF